MNTAGAVRTKHYHLRNVFVIHGQELPLSRELSHSCRLLFVYHYLLSSSSKSSFKGLKEENM